MKNVLVIDTSYGLSVGVAGHEPLTLTDSRKHVEQIEPSIASSLQQAGLEPTQLSDIVVCTGPGPFTGLRAGIVAARALAFATGARLIGQSIIPAQASWYAYQNRENTPYYVLSLNDARRKQLYWQLFQVVDGEALASSVMDIAYPADIAQRVSSIIAKAQEDADQQIGFVLPSSPARLVVVGHGSAKYAAEFEKLSSDNLAVVIDTDQSLTQESADSLEFMAQLAVAEADNREARGEQPPSSEPLYLRRPDAELPGVPKPVLEGKNREAGQATADELLPLNLRAQAPQTQKQAAQEARDLAWSEWDKDDLKRFATKTDPGVDDPDDPDELETFSKKSSQAGADQFSDEMSNSIQHGGKRDGAQRVIRRATYADIPHIQQLEAEAFGPVGWDSQFLDKELAKPDQDRIVVTINKEIAGFAASWTRQKGESMILDVCVFTAFRRQHVANDLMLWLLDDAVAKGQQYMLLQVKVVNHAAQQLYRQFGFEITRRIEHYYLPYEDVDAFEMRKDLSTWASERSQFTCASQLANDCTPGQGNPIREAQADTRHAEVSGADAGNDTAGNAAQNADEKGEEN
ncbi:tRNA (adenosine(37)-N6)-threonylcarbamoyltransferase complex dimerization subunit type 1 TsaB [Aeriscardovia aeriphila]|uniref:tRNA threonylcarbamoyladenosine biosynthesis protein TsaB n=1 Tax=Aeriscardovia aeriphila TaxID=218139 RepID=A0A261F9R1_9BIFI|nr:tRNA (adenosine(37)-N6)-threonylcarbamoyltransferase complex dimerization subunit type 1 TsaB [Aeriscardovia aeriphila]OZG55862.1 tRNA threonylcarbamoyladenosine biosynthesis protein TsaB [Aeriscardovia aeriphila]